jgi:Dna[CI] antecedent, DciA
MPLRPLRDALGTWAPGGQRAPEPIHAISAAWAGIVGANVAANSAPLELSGAVLVVTTSSSAWSQQLQMLSLPILGALRNVPSLPPIERMTFRSGRLPSVKGRSRGGAPGRRATTARALEAALPPAADPPEALERLRKRILAVRRRSVTTCVTCGTPLEDATPQICAPCAGAEERERSLEMQRLVYSAPWLVFEEIREVIPRATVAEFEGARRTLLQRWWVVLERAKRSGTLSRSGVERKLASSYLLLQSRLRPDRITPAVVRNLLGVELEALLWPPSPGKPSGKAPGKAPTANLSNHPKQ